MSQTRIYIEKYYMKVDEDDKWNIIIRYIFDDFEKRKNFNSVLTTNRFKNIAGENYDYASNAIKNIKFSMGKRHEYVFGDMSEANAFMEVIEQLAILNKMQDG